MTPPPGAPRCTHEEPRLEKEDRLAFDSSDATAMMAGEFMDAGNAGSLMPALPAAAMNCAGRPGIERRGRRAGRGAALAAGERRQRPVHVQAYRWQRAGCDRSPAGAWPTSAGSP